MPISITHILSGQLDSGSKKSEKISLSFVFLYFSQEKCKILSSISVALA